MNQIAMRRDIFSKNIGITPKTAIVNVVLVASAFLWYFYAFDVLKEIITTDSLLIWGVNLVGIAFAAIFGAKLMDRFKRRFPFLLSWMVAGVILSFAPLILDLSGTPGIPVLSAIFGVYFGLGIPACLGYFSASTTPENRARVGGFIFLCIGLGIFLLSTIGSGDMAINVLVLSSLRAVALLIMLFVNIDEKPMERSGKMSYASILANRSFLFYFIPWCMFSLVNYLAVPVISKFFGTEFARSSTIIESILIGVFAVVGGFVADFLGRKRLAIVGFALLGLGYAILGVYPKDLNGWYFYTFVDGIAWGAFYTIFLITLWGDLAQGRSSEKYYAIGGLPYLFSNFMRLWLGSYVADAVTSSAVFSFASIFLFLAVLPLVYAPETLPEKTIKDRELKQYIDKAKKTSEKYTLK